MTTAIFKCRKCRCVLFDGNVVVTAHGDRFNFDEDDSEVSCSSVDSTVWYIGEICFPEWIRVHVEEANWLKGKLSCPKCTSRLGSFDFTNGVKCQCRINVLPAVHITKARVDCDIFNPLHVSDAMPMVSYPIRATLEKKRLSNDEVVNDNERSTTAVNSTVVPHSSTARLIQPRQSKQRISYQQRGDLYAITSFHSSLDNKQDNLTCPICLEMYYCPTVCHPCRHVFCDPCLRRLAKRKPTKTPCPLCRQIIRQCTPHAEFQQQILLHYPCHHASRKTIECDLDTQNLPLPWKPKYHFRWFSRQTNSSSTWHLLGGNFMPFLGISTLHIRVSTLSLLLVLLAVCIITCAGGFFFVKYLIWLFQWLSGKCQRIVSHFLLSFIELVTSRS